MRTAAASCTITRRQRAQVDGAGPGRLLEHHRARGARVAREQPERDDRAEAVAHEQVDRAVQARGDAVDERVEVERAVAADVARVPGQVDRPPRASRAPPAPGRSATTSRPAP